MKVYLVYSELSMSWWAPLGANGLDMVEIKDRNIISKTKLGERGNDVYYEAELADDVPIRDADRKLPSELDFTAHPDFLDKMEKEGSEDPLHVVIRDIFDQAGRSPHEHQISDMWEAFARSHGVDPQPTKEHCKQLREWITDEFITPARIFLKEGNMKTKIAVDKSTKDYFETYFMQYGAMLTRDLAFKKLARKKAQDAAEVLIARWQNPRGKSFIELYKLDIIDDHTGEYAYSYKSDGGGGNLGFLTRDQAINHIEQLIESWGENLQREAQAMEESAPVLEGSKEAQDAEQYLVYYPNFDMSDGPFNSEEEANHAGKARGWEFYLKPYKKSAQVMEEPDKWVQISITAWENDYANGSHGTIEYQGAVSLKSFDVYKATCILSNGEMFEKSVNSLDDAMMFCDSHAMAGVEHLSVQQLQNNQSKLAVSQLKQEKVAQSGIKIGDDVIVTETANNFFEGDKFKIRHIDDDGLAWLYGDIANRSGMDQSLVHVTKLDGSDPVTQFRKLGGK